MKALKNLTYFACVLALAASCGKDNKSGKNNNGYGSYGAYSAYSSGGISIAQVINENPCGGNNNYVAAIARTEINVPLTNLNTVIPNGDVYIGVTSYGDVGAVIGTGAVPMFVGYICPGYPSGSGMIVDIRLGSYTTCQVKSLTSATMTVNNYPMAYFRPLEAGSSAGTRFSFCR